MPQVGVQLICDGYFLQIGIVIVIFNCSTAPHSVLSYTTQLGESIIQADWFADEMMSFLDVLNYIMQPL